MHRTVYAVQKDTFCTKVYGASIGCTPDALLCCTLLRNALLGNALLGNATYFEPGLTANPGRLYDSRVRDRVACSGLNVSSPALCGCVIGR